MEFSSTSKRDCQRRRLFNARGEGWRDTSHRWREADGNRWSDTNHLSVGNLGWFPLWLPDQERRKITAGASDAPRPEGVSMVGRMFTADGSFGASTLLSCLRQFFCLFDTIWTSCATSFTLYVECFHRLDGYQSICDVWSNPNLLGPRPWTSGNPLWYFCSAPSLLAGHLISMLRLEISPGDLQLIMGSI